VVGLYEETWGSSSFLHKLKALGLPMQLLWLYEIWELHPPEILEIRGREGLKGLLMLSLLLP